MVLITLKFKILYNDYIFCIITNISKLKIIFIINKSVNKRPTDTFYPIKKLFSKKNPYVFSIFIVLGE